MNHFPLMRLAGLVVVAPGYETHLLVCKCCETEAQVIFSGIQLSSQFHAYSGASGGEHPCQDCNPGL